MLGQPASWQTVCRPSDFTRLCILVYSGPIFARVLIHSGLRSMGVWLFRTSRRSILRPSGATADTSGTSLCWRGIRIFGEHQSTPVDYLVVSGHGVAWLRGNRRAPGGIPFGRRGQARVGSTALVL